MVDLAVLYQRHKVGGECECRKLVRQAFHTVQGAVGEMSTTCRYSA